MMRLCTTILLSTLLGYCPAIAALASPNIFRSAESFGKIPLSFVENQGQVDNRARFMIQGPEGAAFFTQEGIAFSLKERDGSDLIREVLPLSGNARAMRLPREAEEFLSQRDGTERSAGLLVTFVKPDASMRLEGCGELPGKINYFRGSNPQDWKTNIRTYSGVAYRSVWPGIDVIYRGNGQQLKYDIQIAPGADISQIRLKYEGAEQLSLSDSGDLVVRTAAATFSEAKPGIYQEKDGQRIPVEGEFALEGNTVGFQVADYDPALPLVIDPASDLIWSTLLGGSYSDFAHAMVVDSSGCVYVTGATDCSGFPTTPGALNTGFGDAFVTKLNSSGSALLYSTFLGGREHDFPNGIAVDSSGCAYVVGYTYSSDFPTTPGAFNTSYGNGGYSDAFVAKLNPSGSALLYSGLLGGTDGDSAVDIAVDASGCAYIAGYVHSWSFPNTPGTSDSSNSDVADMFVAKLNPSGSAWLYSHLLGGREYGNARGIAVDSSGCAYVTGGTGCLGFPTTPGAYDTSLDGYIDAFVMKLNPSGSALIYSSFIGGSGDEDAFDIAVDPSGCAYVTGRTTDPYFPTTPGAFDTSYNDGPSHNGDVYVAKLDSSGSALLYSTFLGADVDDWVYAIAVDSSGYAYVAGYTNSSRFPTTANAFDTSWNGSYDGFVSLLSPSGSELLYSTFLGGSGMGGVSAIALDGSDNAIVAGSTTSFNFPTTPGAFDTSFNGKIGILSEDVFVSKLRMGAGPGGYTQTYETPQGFVRPGWNLVSLPAGPMDTDPASIFSSLGALNANLQYWRNDIAAGSFQSYGSSYGWTGPLKRGIPYWFLNPGGLGEISHTGYTPMTDFQLAIPSHPIAPFWIMFGTPFPNEVPCANVFFLNSVSGPPAKNWSDAYSAHLVESKALGFDSASQQFFTAGPSDFHPDRTVLQPWYGYWLLVDRAGKMIITFPKPQ